MANSITILSPASYRLLSTLS